jgi:lipopolysaccharide/colanic/teichoic acid biosynthesis glycosyltransferase
MQAIITRNLNSAARSTAGRSGPGGLGQLAKRTLDLCGAAGLLIAVSPVLLLAIVAIRILMGRPVFFVQERAGLHGRAFSLYKLRTMKELRGPDGELLPDEQRIDRTGQILRKFSIDEFPQCWNVIKGDMSLVGPRPLLTRYLSRYNNEQLRRHDVLPGITGLAQVKGRNMLTWEEKFRWDVWYVEHWTLWLDIQILMRTVVNVLTGANTVEPGSPNDPEFYGTEGPPSVQTAGERI